MPDRMTIKAAQSEQAKADLASHQQELGDSNRSGSPENSPNDWLPEQWCELPWTQLRKMLLSACEREYIRYHLEASRGRIGVVAKRTGLSSRAVNLMLKRQRMSKESFKNHGEK